METFGNVVGLLLLIAFLVAMFVFWPFVVIWALNTLFPVLAISMSFWTWLSVVIINITYFLPVKYRSKN